MIHGFGDHRALFPMRRPSIWAGTALSASKGTRHEMTVWVGFLWPLKLPFPPVHLLLGLFFEILPARQALPKPVFGLKFLT